MFIRSLLVAALLLISQAASGQPIDPVSLRADADRIASAAASQPGAGAISLAIALNNEVIISKAYGLADPEHRIPADENSVFRICSVSKQFCSAAILRLADQGKLTLDDPVQKHLPEFPTHGRTITLRQLLSHTSGLASYTELSTFKLAEQRDLSHDELVTLFKDEPRVFEPGQAFQYCNSGSYLLGMVVERISGQSYADFLRDQFIAPLGLAHTSYDTGNAIVPGRVRGCTLSDNQLANAPYISWQNAFAGGGLLSTARELLQWNLALSSGKVVSPESYKAMTTPFTFNNGDTDRYGLCLWSDSNRGHRRVFHTGHGPGFTAILLSYPDDALAIALLSGSDAVEAPKIGHAIAAAALNLPPLAPLDLPVPEAERRAWSGAYSCPHILMDFQILADGDRLIAQPSAAPKDRMLYQGDGRFRAAYDPEIEVQFPLLTAPCDSFTINEYGARLTAHRK